MYDLINDIITCCVCSCDTGKIVKSFLKTRKRENMEIKEFFYINLHLKDCLDIEFTSQADAIGSADIIYRI